MSAFSSVHLWWSRLLARPLCHCFYAISIPAAILPTRMIMCQALITDVLFLGGANEVLIKLGLTAPYKVVSESLWILTQGLLCVVGAVVGGSLVRCCPSLSSADHLCSLLVGQGGKMKREDRFQCPSHSLIGFCYSWVVIDIKSHALFRQVSTLFVLLPFLWFAKKIMLQHIQWQTYKRENTVSSLTSVAAVFLEIFGLA